MRATRLAAALLLASPLALTTACAATGNAPQAAVERAPVGATGQAVLINASGANIGRVDLRQGPTGLLMKIEASGLTPGWHGIHIHAEAPHYDHHAFKPWRVQALAFKAIRSLYPDYPLWRDFPYEYAFGKLPIDVIYGGPGLREAYGPTYYAAFVRDPDRAAERLVTQKEGLQLLAAVIRFWT